jgi:hypothetical protein
MREEADHVLSANKMRARQTGPVNSVQIPVI